MEAKGFYKFDPYCIDVAQRILLREGQIVHLTPKAFDILLLLVRSHGKIVDKDDLMRSVWPDSFVEEGNLTFNINVLRKVLSEDKSRRQYIETVRKRGYRFIADVRHVDEEDSCQTHSLGDGRWQNESDLQQSVYTQPLEKKSANRILDIVWPYRKWMLVIGFLASAAVLFDFVFISRGVILPEHLVFAGLAAVSLYIYIRGSWRVISPDPAVPQASAFRGLLPFEPSDKDRFYGRDIDTAALVDLVSHSQFRFGVLYGDSGSGKTSLIGAGLLPQLEAKGYTVIHCRSYKDPIEAILAECQRRSGVALRDADSATDYILKVARRSGSGLVIICDQFEEFFINVKGKRKRSPFFELVNDCFHSTNFPVKFLFSVRSDFLYLVPSAFEDRIPETLLSSRRYHLQHFDKDQAAEIIEMSMRKANWHVEPGLIWKMARDLAVNETVLPSELQIVGEQLQNKRIFTLEGYTRAGGKEQLVHSYLEDVNRLTPDQETAHLLLRCLISDEDTGLTLTLTEISELAQRNARAVEHFLKIFIQARLIREIQDGELWRYELMHEYLIDRINQITGRVIDARRRANRMLQQYLSIYAVDKRALIPITKQWFIRRYSDLEKGERGRELLKRSLRQGLLKACALTLLLALLSTVAAAWFSMGEEWEGVRLSDGHTRAVRQAAFSPDGRLLVSVAEDYRVIVWDFARRERMATLTDHTDWVVSVAFSPDGKLFATGSFDRTVIVWDAATLKKAAVLQEHTTVVTGIAFSPDSRLLASISSPPEGHVVVWDVNGWEKVREFPGSGYDPFALIFSPNSRYIIGPRFIENGITHGCWDIATGQAVAKEMLTSSENSSWYGGVAASSPDAAILVAVGYRTVDFWDASQYWARKQRKLLSSQPGHQDWPRAVAFSPDSRLVATGSEDIILWDVKTQTKLARLEHTAIVWGLAFSPNGRWLVSTHGDGAILVWDAVERKRAANFNEHSEAVRSVAFSPDGKQIASASDDGSIIIWDPGRNSKQAVLMGHTTRATGVAFSSDGSLFASCAQNGEVILWDLAQRQARWISTTLGSRWCVAFSPDSHWLATTHGVLDCNDGRWVVHADSNKDWQLAGIEMYGVAVSPDGRRLVCVSPKKPIGIISLWDTGNWQMLERIEVSGASFICVSFSPDGKYLVTGDDEGAVRLWSVNSLKEIAAIGRHTSRLKSVAFMSDGRQVASAGDDKTISLWDVSSRKLITRIGTHTSRVLSVAFSPDGKQIVSGEEDKAVNIYTRHHTLWGYRWD